MHCPSHTGNAFQPGQPPTPQKKCLSWVSLAPGHPAFEQASPHSLFSQLQPPWVVVSHCSHCTSDNNTEASKHQTVPEEHQEMAWLEESWTDHPIRLLVNAL